MNKWISTRKAMPAFHRYVLIKFKPLKEGHQSTAIAFRDGNEDEWEWAWCNPYSCFTFDDSKKVTHWRSIP